MRYSIINQSGSVVGVTDDRNAAMKQASFYRGYVLDEKTGRKVEATSHPKVFMSNPRRKTQVKRSRDGWTIRVQVGSAREGVSVMYRLYEKGGAVQKVPKRFPGWVEAEVYGSKADAQSIADQVAGKSEEWSNNPPLGWELYHGDEVEANPKSTDVNVFHGRAGWAVEVYIRDAGGTEDAIRILRRTGGRIQEFPPEYRTPPHWVQAWFTSKQKAEEAANQLLDASERLHINPEDDEDDEGCACLLGSTCDVSHDPADCSCFQCVAAEYNVPEAFLTGAAFAFWADAFTHEVEDTREGGEEELADEWSPGPGGRWEDILPETPPEAESDAGLFLQQLLEANGQSSFSGLKRISHVHSNDLADFGYYLVMEGLGSGVSWEDDHSPHHLQVPSVEPSAATRDAAYVAIHEPAFEN